MSFMLFSGHISTSSLMSINYSILEYIVQKVMLNPYRTNVENRVSS